MPALIRIEIEAGAVTQALDRLVERGTNLRPAFAAIGELLLHSTKQRFSSGEAPDGTPWAPNRPSTIEHYLAAKSGLFDKLTGKRTGTKKGYFNKDGRLSKKGAAVLAAKKPLHGVSGMLEDQIFPNVLPDGVEIGSSMVYSAMQQFGGTQSRYPHLWGDIPARPFLGLSASDEQGILDIVEEFLAP